jgi:hypothetical protein
MSFCSQAIVAIRLAGLCVLVVIGSSAQKASRSGCGLVARGRFHANGFVGDIAGATFDAVVDGHERG